MNPPPVHCITCPCEGDLAAACPGVRGLPHVCRWAAEARPGGIGAILGLARARHAAEAGLPPMKPRASGRHPEPPYIPGRVVIRAYCCSWTGYGIIAEQLGRGLEAIGVPVAYWPLMLDDTYIPASGFERDRLVDGPGDEWVLQLAVPKTTPMPGRKTVVFSMWETDGLPVGSVADLNAAEAVIVPCRFNASTFRDAGVTRPIHVVPMGVDLSVFRMTEDPPARPFVLGMAFRARHGGWRKNWRRGVEAFRAAFPDEHDVRLLLKGFPDCRVDEAAFGGDPRVTLDRTPMRPPEMAAWYRGLSALFVPSRGEGWGLHTLEAMACGRPVIAALETGTKDFVEESCCWPLEVRSRPAGEFYRSSGNWLSPTMRSMVSALRRAYEHPDEVVAKGRAAAGRARQFPWSRSARELRRVLVEVGAIAPKPKVALGTPHCVPCRAAKDASP